MVEPPFSPSSADDTWCWSAPISLHFFNDEVVNDVGNKRNIVSNLDIQIGDSDEDSVSRSEVHHREMNSPLNSPSSSSSMSKSPSPLSVPPLEEVDMMKPFLNSRDTDSNTEAAK